MPPIAPGALAPAATPSPVGRRRGARSAALIVLLVATIAAGAWFGARRLLAEVAGESCTVRAAGQTFQWAPDQMSNSAAITAISVRRELPPRAATIAIATAMQESKVRNVRYGDRDSLGLFQQRPSQGWGTAEQILDPEYATNQFYDALIRVEGYSSMGIADAAQEVQRSADGSAYAQHEPKARVTASVLSGQTSAGIGCSLREPTVAGNPRSLVSLVEKDFGLRGDPGDGRVTVRAADDERAWAIGSWAVARATETGAVAVTVGDRRWERDVSERALTWHPAKEPVDYRTVVIDVG
jgi:hypothetical protein